MIELKQNIDRNSVEDAYRRAKIAQEKNTYGSARWSAKALNHARNRDPRILNALEKASNVLNAMWEDQLGEYSRGVDVEHSHTSKPVEVSLFQEAYRLADEGNAIPQLKWIYYASYELAYGRIED